MSFLPKKAIWGPVSIKALSLILYVQSDRIVIITLAEKRFLSVAFWISPSFARRKGITEYSGAVLWLFLPQPCSAPFGWGRRWRTSCSYCRLCKHFQKLVTPGPLRGGQACCCSSFLSDNKELCKNKRTKQEPCFPEVLRLSPLVRMKALTSFPKGNGRIIFFQA